MNVMKRFFCVFLGHRRWMKGSGLCDWEEHWIERGKSEHSVVATPLRRLDALRVLTKLQGFSNANVDSN